MYTTRSQVISQQQLQRSSNNNNNNNNAVAPHFLIPASRWLARKIHTGCIKPLHNGAATISGDPQEDGTLAIRTDTSDGKRLANVIKVRALPKVAGDTSTTSTTQLHRTNLPHAFLGENAASTTFVVTKNSNLGKSAATTVAAICSIPRDRGSAPGEVWVGWSNGKITIMNEPANKVLVTLPSISATSGAIVALIPFFSGSPHQRRIHPFSVDSNTATSSNNSSSSVPASWTSSTTSICDGGWLFGRSAPSGRSAVMVVTSSGTLTVIDTRSRSLMFRVPPSHTPRTSLVKCASALSDDSRALILLATEDCLVHAVELKIRAPGAKKQQRKSESSTSASSAHHHNHHHQQQQAAPVCVPRIVQVLSVAPLDVTNVEVDCCPTCMATSTTFLRDPTPTIFVGFLTGHACFFKILFTGISSPGVAVAQDKNSHNNNNNQQRSYTEFGAPSDFDNDGHDGDDDDDSYMMLFNQAGGMTRAHDYGEAVVAVIPIHHHGSGCITVTKAGACVFSIDQKIRLQQAHQPQPQPQSQRRQNDDQMPVSSASCSRSRYRIVGWKPIQRVENNFDPQYSYPIGGTALSSNEVVLLLSDGGLRRLLVANPDPLDQEGGSPQGQDKMVSPRRQHHATNRKRTKFVTVLVKKRDPVTGQEFDVEEQIEVPRKEDGEGDDARGVEREGRSNSDDDSDNQDEHEQDFFPPQLQSPESPSFSSSASPRRQQQTALTIMKMNAAERYRFQRLHPSSVSPTTGGHGFWSSPGRAASASRLRNQNDSTNNENVKASAATSTTKRKANSAVSFPSNSEFVDRAMLLADSIQRLYTAEANFREAIVFEQDGELGFLWHLHKSGIHGKEFLINQERAMRSLTSVQAEEREARMKGIVTTFFTSMIAMKMTETFSRRKVELCEREEEDRFINFRAEEDAFDFLYSLMYASGGIGSGRFLSMLSTASPQQQRQQQYRIPSSSTTANNIETAERQIARERSKNEIISRENAALGNTVQTLQALLKEEQQRNELLVRQRDVPSSSLSSSTSSAGATIATLETRNSMLKGEIERLAQQLSRAEKQLTDERQIHEHELTDRISENRRSLLGATTTAAKSTAVQQQQQQQAAFSHDHHHHQYQADPVSSFSSRSVSPNNNNNNNNNNNTNNNNNNNYNRANHQFVTSPSSPERREPLVGKINSLLVSSPTHQHFYDLRRALEDEQIKRGDAERSLAIVTNKLEKLTSILAHSEVESREQKLNAETLSERLRLTSSELEQVRKELGETSRRAERFEDLARRFEGEFSLRDQQYNQACRERDMILTTSDAAIAAVEDQQQTIRRLSRSQDALKRSSRKLLALCDIAVSVGSEPPAMSSLRKFLRELMMDCATLKRYDLMPTAATERLQAIYERTTAIQDNLFHPANPSMVVLDKSEAVEVMSTLRSALENAG